jgi:hypothetical protein
VVTRKNFILTLASVVVVSGLSIPYLIHRSRNSMANNPLKNPGFLFKLLDENTVRQIGISYRSKFSLESKAAQLEKILLTDGFGKTLQADDNSYIHNLMQEKVKFDFETGKTVIVNGWILAVTEARQCALYSIKSD